MFDGTIFDKTSIAFRHSAAVMHRCDLTHILIATLILFIINICPDR